MFPSSTLIECGFPLGRQGRYALLPFLAESTQKSHRVLWINGHDDLTVFPPAWFSKGIEPSHLIFANSPQPVSELRRAIIHPLFRIVVIDAAAGQVNRRACAFLAIQARKHRKTIIVIRNYFLSHRSGNPFARLRFNGFNMEETENCLLRPVRGLTTHDCLYRA